MTTPEIHPISSPRLVNPGEFQAVSHQLWNSPVYGTVAANWLEFTSLNRAHAEVYHHPEGGYELRTRFADRQQITDRERIVGVMRALHPDLPYALTMEPPDPIDYDGTERCPTFTISPTGLSTLRIGNYLHRRNLVNHSFHGTFGKALDVLAVISEQKQPRDIGASHVEIPFINHAELAAQVPNMPLSKAQKRDVIPRVKNLARTQVQRSEISKHGEVILEGMVVIEATSRFSFERVAQQTLATTIPASCKPGSPMAAHLRRAYGVPTVQY